MGLFAMPSLDLCGALGFSSILHTLCTASLPSPAPNPATSIPTDCVPPPAPAGTVVVSLKSTEASHLAHSTPYIPLELVIAILEYAYLDCTKLQQDTRTLLAASLVCRSWSPPAQALLFREVSLRSHRAFLAFSGAIANNLVSDGDAEGCKGKVLSKSVVKLRVVLDRKQPDNLRLQNFVDAVLLCPNLYDLNVSLYGGPSNSSAHTDRPFPPFSPSALGLFRRANSVRSLTVSNWTDNRELAPQLVGALTGIKHLTLRGVVPGVSGSVAHAQAEVEMPDVQAEAPEGLEMDAKVTAADEAAQAIQGGPPPATPMELNCQLESFSLDIQTLPASSAASLHTLLEPSASTLRSLTFTRPPPPVLLASLISTHGPSLESLFIPKCQDHEVQEVIIDALDRGHLGALKEFGTSSAWICPGLLRTLPKRMQKVAFALNTHTPIRALASAMRNWVATEVAVEDGTRELTLNVYVAPQVQKVRAGSGNVEACLRLLMKACEEARVKINVFEDEGMFMSEIRGDCKSVSDLVHMARLSAH